MPGGHWWSLPHSGLFCAGTTPQLSATAIQHFFSRMFQSVGGNQKMDSVLERTSGTALFGQLGCSLRSKFWKGQRPTHQGINSGAVVALRIPRRGADHSPQTGSKHARRRHPQSGLSLPEMLRTFQGVGKEHQGIEDAPLT